MTQMSERHRPRSAGSRANRPTRQVRSVLARTLHDRVAIVRVLVYSLAGGCVIPPSLSSSTTDAGLDSPPAITHAFSDQQELTEGGPVFFQQGPGTLNLELRDNDLGDTLYAYVFVDYNNPDQTPPRVTCPPAPSSAKSPDRATVCDLGGLCQTPDLGQTRGMQIVVFDRQPLDSGLPQYQNIPPDGLSTDRFYYLKCQPRS